ncbi:hypothetical protein HDU97_001097 [Phlyctochytrium planicorne]|nr:hypothetical protein HDU97_001097 [Phlyctochytrium planicorne]
MYEPFVYASSLIVDRVKDLRAEIASLRERNYMHESGAPMVTVNTIAADSHASHATHACRDPSRLRESFPSKILVNEEYFTLGTGFDLPVRISTLNSEQSSERSMSPSADGFASSGSSSFDDPRDSEDEIVELPQNVHLQEHSNLQFADGFNVLVSLNGYPRGETLNVGRSQKWIRISLSWTNGSREFGSVLGFPEGCYIQLQYKFFEYPSSWTPDERQADGFCTIADNFLKENTFYVFDWFSSRSIKENATQLRRCSLILKVVVHDKKGGSPIGMGFSGLVEIAKDSKGKGKTAGGGNGCDRPRKPEPSSRSDKPGGGGLGGGVDPTFLGASRAPRAESNTRNGEGSSGAESNKRRRKASNQPFANASIQMTHFSLLVHDDSSALAITDSYVVLLEALEVWQVHAWIGTLFYSLKNDFLAGLQLPFQEDTGMIALSALSPNQISFKLVQTGLKKAVEMAFRVFSVKEPKFCRDLLMSLEAVENLVKEAELSVFYFLSKFRFDLAAGIPARLLDSLTAIKSRFFKIIKRSLPSTDKDDNNDFFEEFEVLASKTIKAAKSLVEECVEYEEFINVTGAASLSRVTADLSLDTIVSEHLSTHENGEVVVFTADYTRREQSKELKAIFDKLSHKLSTDPSKKLVIRIAEEPLYSSDIEAKHGIAMFRKHGNAFKCEPTWNLTDECRALTSPHIRAPKEMHERVDQYPSELPYLQIPCQCPKDPHKGSHGDRNRPPLWRCEDCHVKFLFDSDDWLYCKCQKASRVKVQDCSFLCMEGNHVSSFVKCDPTLSLGDIRVLVLGQSGCGKSTTIDFIFNSHLFKDLPDAILNNQKMVAPIPVTFQADGYGRLQPDGSIVPYTPARIELGDASTVSDKKNLNVSGESHTKICMQYNFFIYGRKVIFIDCPGFLDTKGCVKDQENAEHIVNFICNSKCLSAALLVMKPNEERITSEMMFSAIQSLENLNPDLSNNIFLAFTCSSTTNFELAGTGAVLQKVQDSLASPRSKLNLLDRDRMFFLDHNGFRLAVAYANGFVLVNDDDGELYRCAEYHWRRSSDESHRLIRELLLISKPSTEAIKELFHSKNFIDNVADVLMRIALAIDDSVAAIKTIQLEMVEAWQRGEDLNQNPMVPKTMADVIRLDNPRMVCTNPTCSDVVRTGDAGSSNVAELNCHAPCCVEGVTQNCISHPHLKHCTVMQDRMCTTCASSGHMCSVEMHKLIVTELKIYYIMVEHPDVLETLMQSNAKVDRNILLQAFYIAELEAIESEKNRITKACAMFVSFILKHSLITPNDSIVKQLETDIEALERLPDKTQSQVNQLASVKAMKKRYLEELKLLQDNRNTGASEDSIDVERIARELDELCNLNRYGDSIRKCVKQLEEYALDIANDSNLPHAKASCNGDKLPRHSFLHSDSDRLSVEFLETLVPEYELLVFILETTEDVIKLR